MKKLQLQLTLALGLGLLFTLSHNYVAQAATLNITPVSACTLSDAIMAANTDAIVGSCAAGSGSDTINLGAGTYTLAADLPAINTGDLNIVGASRDTTIIDGVDLFGTFLINPDPVNVSISNLTVTRNGAASQGDITNTTGNLTVNNVNAENDTAANTFSSIYSFGPSLTITNSHIFGNTNTHTDAGGVSSSGVVIITDTEINNNTGTSSGGIEVGLGTTTLTRLKIHDNTSADGGGITAGGQSFTIVDSAIYNNSVSYYGGGIFITATNATLKNNTISGNTAAEGIGGIFLETGTGVTANFINNTITDNSSPDSAGFGGSGLIIVPMQGPVGTTNLKNNLLSNNLANGAPGNCKLGTFTAFDSTITLAAATSLGGNLSNDGTCTYLTTASDKQNTDPHIGPLADNGGNTLTRALLIGSPAIDGGVTGADVPPNDQRGIARPQCSGIDIGALETTTCPVITVAVVLGSPNTGFGIYLTNPTRTLTIYTLAALGLGGLALVARRKLKFWS